MTSRAVIRALWPRASSALCATVWARGASEPGQRHIRPGRHTVTDYDGDRDMDLRDKTPQEVTGSLVRRDIRSGLYRATHEGRGNEITA